MDRQAYDKLYYEQHKDRKQSQAKVWAAQNSKRIFGLKHKPEYMEKARERAKVWRKANLDRDRANHRKKRERNPQQYQGYINDWYQRDPEHAKLLGRQRRSKRYAAEKANSVGRVDYEAILAEWGRVCFICKRAISESETLWFEHVVPINRGGAHIKENIAPSHRLCNQRKSDRLMEEIQEEMKLWPHLKERNGNKAH
jgi:hypothetical protein